MVKSCLRTVRTANHGKTARIFQWMCEKQHWGIWDIRKEQQGCESEQQRKGCKLSLGSHLYNPEHLKCVIIDQVRRCKANSAQPSIKTQLPIPCMPRKNPSVWIQCCHGDLQDEGDISWRAHLEKGSAGKRPWTCQQSPLSSGDPCSYLASCSSHPCSTENLQEKASHLRAPLRVGHKTPFHSWWGSFWDTGRMILGRGGNFSAKVWNVCKAVLVTRDQWGPPLLLHYNTCTQTRVMFSLSYALVGEKKKPFLFLKSENASMYQHSSARKAKTV